MKSSLAVVGLLAAFQLAGCRADSGASTVSLEWLTSNPRPAVPPDRDISLKLVKGMAGLVPHGDELMVMVFGDSSREADILEENKAIGERSLQRYLQANPTEIPGRKLLRVPDAEDESGSRFFYYEALSPNRWKLIAVCAGAWLQDADNPPVCSLYYRVGRKTVSYELEEAFLVRHHRTVAEHVFRSLGYRV